MFFSLFLLKKILIFKKEIYDEDIISIIKNIGIEINSIIKFKDILNKDFKFINNKIYIKFNNNIINKDLLTILSFNFNIINNEEIYILSFKNKKLYDDKRIQNLNENNFIDILFNNDTILDLEFTSNLSYLKNHYNLALYLKKFLSSCSGINEYFNLIQKNKYKINNSLSFFNFKSFDLINKNNQIPFFSLTYVKVDNNYSQYNSLFIVLGIRHINYIVDFTHYFEVLYGSPLHCYPKINLKIDYLSNINNINKYKIFNKNEIIYNKNKILVSTNNNKEILCILGIKGIEEFRIKEEDIEFIIELAHYNYDYIDLVEESLKLKTKASFYFKAFNYNKNSILLLQKLLYLLNLNHDVKNIFQKNINIKKKSKYIIISYIEFKFIFGFDISNFNDIVYKIFTKKRCITINHDFKINIFELFEQHITDKFEAYQEIVKYMEYDLNFYLKDNKNNNNNYINKLNSNYFINDSFDFFLQNKIFNIKEILNNNNFLEIITDSFVKDNKIKLINPLFKKKNSLRSNIIDSFKEYIILSDLNSNIINMFYEIGKSFVKINNQYKEKLILFIAIIKNDVNNIFYFYYIIQKLFEFVNINDQGLFINNFLNNIHSFKMSQFKNSFNNKTIFYIEIPLYEIFKFEYKNKDNKLYTLVEINNLKIIDITIPIITQKLLKLNLFLLEKKVFFKVISIFFKNNIYHLTFRFYLNNNVDFITFKEEIISFK